MAAIYKSLIIKSKEKGVCADRLKKDQFKIYQRKKSQAV